MTRVSDPMRRAAAAKKGLHAYAEAWRDMAPHVDYLAGLAGFFSPTARIVEFGRRGGVSTWAFLSGMSPDGKITSFDIRDAWVPPAVRDDARASLLIGNSLDPLTWGSGLWHEDIVLLDTNHGPETAREVDLIHGYLYPKVLLVHDYFWPDVKAAMDKQSYFELHEIREAADAQGDFSLGVFVRPGVVVPQTDDCHDVRGPLAPHTHTLP